MELLKHLAHLLTVIIVLIACFGRLAVSIRPLKAISDILPTKHHGANLEDQNLAMLISEPAIDETEVFTEALKLISSIQASTSCYRLAAAHLLISCREFDGSIKRASPQKVTAVPITLENIKEIYAARLAICELQGAGAAVPSQCLPLATQNGEGSRPHTRSLMGMWRKQKKDYPGEEEYDHGMEDSLSQCLKTLETRPQWWMSYSNSRQNAVVMCQAARTEVEKDELLDIHRVMAGVASEVNDALSNTVKDSRFQLNKQKEFADAVNSFQMSLVQELEGNKIRSQNLFKKIFNDLGEIMSLFKRETSSAGEAVAQELNSLNHNIRSSNDDVHQLREIIMQVFEDSKLHGSEFVSIHSRDLVLNNELVSRLKNSLDEIRNSEIQGLSKVVGDINSNLQISNHLVSRMHERQNTLDERLDSLNQAFEHLEMKAVSFRDAQSQQAETQAQLRDSLRSDIRLAQALLGQVTAAAANLQSTIEETSARVSQMGLLTGLSGSASRWSWLTMIMIGIALFSRRVAGGIAICAGLLYTFQSLYHPFLELFQPVKIKVVTTSIDGVHPSHLLNQHWLILVYIGVSVIATFIIIIVYTTTRRFRSRQPSTQTSQTEVTGAKRLE